MSKTNLKKTNAKVKEEVQDWMNDTHKGIPIVKWPQEEFSDETENATTPYKLLLSLLNNSQLILNFNIKYIYQAIKHQGNI